jgi:RNA polymerase sigma-70 factor, ECF subfamily
VLSVQTSENKIVFDAGVWVDRHGDYLYAFAFSRVHEETIAEDLVQETLLAALQARNAFSGKSNERTWLTGILKHKIIDHFRRASRQVDLTDEEKDMSSYDYLFERDDEWNGHWNNNLAPIQWSSTPEAVLERSEFRGIVTHCLGELPERAANAFALREMEGLEAKEICDVLMISLSNYWVLMHRARLHLRRCLEFNWFRKV